MTAAELIAELEKLPGEAELAISDWHREQCTRILLHGDTEVATIPMYSSVCVDVASFLAGVTFAEPTR